MTGLGEKYQCLADVNNIVDAPLLPFYIQNRRENVYKDIKEYFRKIFNFVSRHLVMVRVRHSITAALQ